MTTERFKKLVDLTGVAVKKMDTNYRLSIGVEERIAIFLRYESEFICNINIDRLLWNTKVRKLRNILFLLVIGSWALKVWILRISST
jgi:hypothetical protein